MDAPILFGRRGSILLSLPVLLSSGLSNIRHERGGGADVALGSSLSGPQALPATTFALELH